MIDTLASMKAERRILVAGEMLELGPTAEALHRECGLHAAEKKIDFVIGVRGMARAVAEAACGAGTQAQFVETPEQAGEWLARNLRPGRRGAAQGFTRRETGARSGDVAEKQYLVFSS